MKHWLKGRILKKILLINDVYIVVFCHGIAGDVFSVHIKHVSFSIWMRLDYVLIDETFIIHYINVNKSQQVHYLCLWCRISCSIVTSLYIERHRKGYQCKLPANYINRQCVLSEMNSQHYYLCSYSFFCTLFSQWQASALELCQTDSTCFHHKYLRCSTNLVANFIKWYNIEQHMCPCLKPSDAEAEIFLANWGNTMAAQNNTAVENDNSINGVIIVSIQEVTAVNSLWPRAVI